MNRNIFTKVVLIEYFLQLIYKDNNLEKDHQEAGDPNPALQGSDPQPAGQHGKVSKTVLFSNR